MSTYTRDWGEAITLLWEGIQSDTVPSPSLLEDVLDLGNCASDSYERDLSENDVEQMYYALLEIKKGLGLLQDANQAIPLLHLSEDIHLPRETL